MWFLIIVEKFFTHKLCLKEKCTGILFIEH